MSEVTRETKIRRNFDSIRNGALSLTLSERARLAKELKESVQKEADDAASAAKEAKEMAEGL